jgi:plastocyanin
MTAVRGVLAALMLIAVLAGSLSACASAGAAGPPAATSSVELPPSYRFAPAAVTVAAGTTVMWTNDDHFSHSVQFLDGGLPSTPLVMHPGQTASFTFSHPGVFHYQCSFHPQNMQGSVTVTP